jgi:two-component system, cell cycle response regulator DivK
MEAMERTEQGASNDTLNPNILSAMVIRFMAKRILIVEDHNDMVEVLEHELKSLGYEAITARNGLEAIELAQSETPDVIILDIMLPKLNGFEATFQIRNNPQTQFIPILAATAKALPGDREQCLRAGCDGYLAKPFTQLELGQAIVELLNKQALQKVL